jgi:hypothetical protein
MYIHIQTPCTTTKQTITEYGANFPLVLKRNREKYSTLSKKRNVKKRRRERGTDGAV